MKWLNIVVLITLMSITGVSLAGQQYYEARSDAMNGTGVASSNRQGAAFINPALLALDVPSDVGGALMLPVLGTKLSNVSNLTDKFDVLQLSYDGLERAIGVADQAAIEQYRRALISDLQSLQGERAYASVGLGMSLVLPTVKMPMALFYKTYIDAVGVAAVSRSDRDNLNSLDVNNQPNISELDSQGAVVAGGVSDLGVALSFPLSIVNMPIAVGISPKMQRIDTYNYVVNANSFNVYDADDARYRNDDTVFNVDVGVAIQPTAGFSLGVSGRNLINHKQQTVDTLGRQFTYRIEPLYTAGVAYDWANLSLTTDIDLNDYQRFDEVASTQYWRFAGELKTADWLALRVGYRHDLNNTTIDLYSVGTGFSIGRSFNLDLTGLFGSDDGIGGVIQTSYHF